MAETSDRPVNRVDIAEMKDTNQPATSVVTNPDAAMMTAQPRHLQLWFVERYPSSIEDPLSVQRRIVENILATDADSVLDVKESLDSAGSLVRRPIRIEEVESVLPSTYGGIYLQVRITTLDDGEVRLVNFGSPTILAQLKTLIDAGKLPIECKVVPVARGGRDGRNPPLYLRRISY
jgi:hypothetical protein